MASEQKLLPYSLKSSRHTEPDQADQHCGLKQVAVIAKANFYYFKCRHSPQSPRTRFLSFVFCFPTT